MKPADSGIIDLLNDCLTAELTAINQYFVDAKMCADWGYERLAEQFRAESIDEMKDAEVLIDRILYLDGLPNVQRLGAVAVGETVPEKLRAALDLEKSAIVRLNAGIDHCNKTGDNGTRGLLKDILVGEEHHADWLETQLALIDQIGTEHYLAQQVRA